MKQEKFCISLQYESAMMFPAEEATGVTYF